MRNRDQREDREALMATRNRYLLTLIVVFALFVGFVSGGFAAPKKVTTAKPGDCKACHENEKILPANHGDTKGMTYGDCLPCHPKTGTGSLRTKMPGSHTHNLAGVSCEKCHGKLEKQESVEMTKCVTCHDLAKLVEKTATVKPENPHTSPHYGNNLDCNLCHRQHGKSENYCNQCHTFGTTVP